jgi:hypothetical protein
MNLKKVVRPLLNEPVNASHGLISQGCSLPISIALPLGSHFRNTNGILLVFYRGKCQAQKNKPDYTRGN